jgi:hypothetical protein
LIGTGYTVYDWRNDKNVSDVLRRWLLLAQTKFPAVDVIDGKSFDKSLLMEFTFSGSECKGLGACSLLDHLSISLLTGPEWDVSQLLIDRAEVLASLAIQHSQAIVRHASRSSHLETHRTWVRTCNALECTSAEDLFAKRALLFPGLLFCESSKDHLSNIASHGGVCNQVFKRLAELDNYCAGWRSGQFDITALPMTISPESATTMRKFGDRRRFRCPDGAIRVMELHVKLSPEEWRIHFLPDTSKRKVYIGYIGPHLPI